jgi:hypothetical protein
MKKRLAKDEMAWADYLITRVGLLIFGAILLLSAFKIQPLFIYQDTAGMQDAQLLSLVLFMESVDSTNIQRAHYYDFDTTYDGTISISSRYVRADADTKTGSVTTAQALMTKVYPSNSVWNNRSGLISSIADICQGRTGIGDNTLQADDLERINEMLRQIEAELADEPFVPDILQPLIVERVMLNYQGPDSIQRRGVTIVYQ